MKDNTVEILMVEDSPGDIRLAQIALKKAKVLHNLEVVEDGELAIKYLKQEAPYENVTRPDLVLLDLNLPKINGHEVLKFIRSDQSLKVIPVVVLTTSDSEKDVLESYELNANCYITKPVDLERFIEVVQMIESFWIKIVTLPPANR